MYIGLAAEGMLRSAAVNYAGTLPSGVGKSFADNFTRLFDNSAKCCIQKWDEWSKTGVSGTLPEDYRDYIADQASYAYHLFAQSSLSSGDVSAKIHQFCVRNHYAYGGVAAMDFRNIMNGYYQEIVKLLAG